MKYIFFFIHIYLFVLMIDSIFNFVNLFSRYLIAFKNLLRSIESLGIASVYGINYFGRGILLGDNYVSYVRHEALGRDLLNGSLTYVPSLKTLYAELTRTMPGYGRIKSRYFIY